MAKLFTAALLLVLAGCTSLPPVQMSRSPCEVSEASYECQVQRYHDVAQ